MLNQVFPLVDTFLFLHPSKILVLFFTHLRVTTAYHSKIKRILWYVFVYYVICRDQPHQEMAHMAVFTVGLKIG